jgi:hypothetical protein
LKPDVIKIDTEGSELQVLRGARACLENLRPMVILELNSESMSKASADCQAFFQFFGAHKYQLFSTKRNLWGKYDSSPLQILKREDFCADYLTNVLCCPLERPQAAQIVSAAKKLQEISS